MSIVHLPFEDFRVWPLAIHGGQDVIGLLCCFTKGAIDAGLQICV